MTVQCHYCTHYSSAIIVASYLVRMPPFTQAFCSLQVSFPAPLHPPPHTPSQTKSWAWNPLLEIQSSLDPVIPT